MKLFHANLSSGKQLAASHSNPMSNSFIFIMEIQIARCLLLGFFVGLRESAIIGGGGGGGGARCHLKDKKDDQTSYVLSSLLPETKESALWQHRQCHWWPYLAI